VKSSDLKTMVSLPVCRGVRRAALAAGTFTALVTGGLPFIGFDTGLIMGRPSPLPPVLAFIFHLALAIAYGSVLCVLLARSRNGWTLFAASSITTLLYLGNFALLHGVHAIVPLVEWNAMLAHAVFGFTFTGIFKLAEIGVSE
jgi:hypothetical protein